MGCQNDITKRMGKLSELFLLYAPATVERLKQNWAKAQIAGFQVNQGTCMRNLDTDGYRKVSTAAVGIVLTHPAKACLRGWEGLQRTSLP